MEDKSGAGIITGFLAELLALASSIRWSTEQLVASQHLTSEPDDPMFSIILKNCQNLQLVISQCDLPDSINLTNRECKDCLSSIASDIRTPISGIYAAAKGIAYLYSHSNLKYAPSEHTLSELLSNAHKINELFQQMACLSKFTKPDA